MVSGIERKGDAGRYKSGYVWQDLMDEDLITPMSENEYVLKGSLLQRMNNEGDEEAIILKTTPLLSSSTSSTPPPKMPSQEMLELEEDEVVLPEPPPEMEQESPGGGALPEEEMVEKKNGVVKVECGSKGEEPFLGKSGSGRRILRSLLSCREVETDADVQKPTHRRYPENRSWDHARKSWTGYSGRGGEKVVPTSYKPMAEPNCSQCGKTFKPEKLHSHMKSCKAFKAHRKSTGNIEKLSMRTQHTEKFSRETPPSFF
ncbi:hypothetical protein J5N97_010970 [Dioscorea zingiberensis]|uniref:SOSEKI DIX-like domain-containing protein n=1 Tax=Dioscorea zingiberensis TaxID=325984 RepID=A0A9D5CZE8_9LILI|nr:hypothetical protein J5N97_010970 [Dioscorea zingiberensis]